MWAPQIQDFNTNNVNHTISTVYRYSMGRGRRRGEEAMRESVDGDY